MANASDQKPARRSEPGLGSPRLEALRNPTDAYRRICEAGAAVWLSSTVCGRLAGSEMSVRPC